MGLRTQSTVMISKRTHMHNTGTDSTAEGDTHGVMHTAHWSSTPCAQQDRWLYAWTAESTFVTANNWLGRL